ncbi:IMPACT family protein [Sphingomonas sp. NCPPB 2930]
MPWTLAAAGHSDILLKKSRFIGCVEGVDGRPAAVARVAALRQQHPDAAHVCWALRAGGQSAAVDDGEPGGTAGRPMLEVLRHHDLDGVLATVVRYFGGTKLGAGGLVRAYSDAVAQALATASKTEVRRLSTLECEVPYALEGMVRRTIVAAGATLLEVRHGTGVRLQWQMPESDAPACRAALEDGARGAIGWR